MLEIVLQAAAKGLCFGVVIGFGYYMVVYGVEALKILKDLWKIRHL